MRHLTVLNACLMLAAACIAPTEQAVMPDGRVSRPNVYVGWSEPVYDGYKRSSFYLDMRDGTRLAVDLYRPTVDGVLATEKLPVVWMHSPYNRRSYRGGEAAETRSAPGSSPLC